MSIRVSVYHMCFILHDTLNPLDAMGICLNKQKLMYEVLVPSVITPLMDLWTHLCVCGWLSVKFEACLQPSRCVSNRAHCPISVLQRAGGTCGRLHCSSWTHCCCRSNKGTCVHTTCTCVAIYTIVRLH